MSQSDKNIIIDNDNIVNINSKENNNNIYEVEKILKRKKSRNKEENYIYLVKWKDYDEPTWEPEINLNNCDMLLNDFLKNREKEKKLKRKNYLKKKKEREFDNDNLNVITNIKKVYNSEDDKSHQYFNEKIKKNSHLKENIKCIKSLINNNNKELILNSPEKNNNKKNKKQILKNNKYNSPNNKNKLITNNLNNQNLLTSSNTTFLSGSNSPSVFSTDIDSNKNVPKFSNLKIYKFSELGNIKLLDIIYTKYYKNKFYGCLCYQNPNSHEIYYCGMEFDDICKIDATLLVKKLCSQVILLPDNKNMNNFSNNKLNNKI